MALEFTSIEDTHGAALYILFSGASQEQRRFERLIDDLKHAGSEHQVVLLDVKTVDGEKIRDFYDVQVDQLPAALVIADNDTIVHQWHGSAMPSASEIAYHLNRSTHI